MMRLDDDGNQEENFNFKWDHRRSDTSNLDTPSGTEALERIYMCEVPLRQWTALLRMSCKVDPSESKLVS